MEQLRCLAARSYRLVCPRSLRPGEVKRTFRDEASALCFLREVARSSSGMQRLRRLHRSRHAFGLRPTLSDEHLLVHLARQLVHGHLLAVAERQRPTSHTGAGSGGGGIRPATPPPPEAPPSVPEEPVAERHWIIFQVLDDHTERPVEGVDLRLRLPGGRVQTFTTRADGTVFVEGLKPGTVDVQQLLDEDALEVVAIA